MSAPPKSLGVPITGKRQLVEHHASGNKLPSAWRVGTEHEKFVFRRRDLTRVAYEGPDGIRALLQRSMRFGWKPITEDGNVIALENDAGCSITLEPGGQFELSGAPLETIHQTCDEVHEHLRQVREVCEELGLGLVGLASTPRRGVRTFAGCRKRRYAIMRQLHAEERPARARHDAAHLHRAGQPRLSPGSRHGEEIPGRLALQPVHRALANSPFTEGRTQRLRLFARLSGPTPTPTDAARGPSSSRMALVSSATSTTCSTCRCTSSTATVDTSMRAVSPSATSWRADCRPCPANSRR